MVAFQSSSSNPLIVCSALNTCPSITMFCCYSVRNISFLVEVSFDLCYVLSRSVLDSFVLLGAIFVWDADSSRFYSASICWCASSSSCLSLFLSCASFSICKCNISILFDNWFDSTYDSRLSIDLTPISARSRLISSFWETTRSTIPFVSR